MWVINKKTGKLESPKLIAERRKNYVITIFIVLLCLLVITNILLVKENKFLKKQVEIYESQTYNGFQD